MSIPFYDPDYDDVKPLVSSTTTSTFGMPTKAKKPSATKAKSKSKGSDNIEDITGLAQLISIPLAIMGTSNDAYLADVVCINDSVPDIAEAIDAIAQRNERVQKVLTKAGQVGPYGMLLSALGPVIIQVMANHEMIPNNVGSTVSKDELLARLDESV